MKGLKFLLKYKTPIKLCAELGVEMLCTVHGDTILKYKKYTVCASDVVKY